MKTIALDNLDGTIADSLKTPGGDDVFLLTEGSGTLGLLVRVPKELKESEIAVKVMPGGLDGTVVFIVLAKGADSRSTEPVVTGQPTFGSCKGMLEIVAEDDEHLKDFEEYMQ